MKKIIFLLSAIVVILLLLGYFIVIEPRMTRARLERQNYLMDQYTQTFHDVEQAKKKYASAIIEKAPAYKDLAEAYKKIIEQGKRTMDSLQQLMP